MIVFKVDADQDMSIQKDPSSAYEYIHTPGSLEIRPGNLMYVGPNVRGEGANNGKTQVVNNQILINLDQQGIKS